MNEFDRMSSEFLAPTSVADFRKMKERAKRAEAALEAANLKSMDIIAILNDILLYVPANGVVFRHVRQAQELAILLEKATRPFPDSESSSADAG